MSIHRLPALAGLLLAVIPAPAQVPSATDLLAKAQIALAQNREREKHWNWTTVETQTVLNGAGHEQQRLPDVTVESVIRQDGRRCTAVLSWGDGVTPYKLNEDADARCSGQDPVEPPLRIEELLKNPKATLANRSTIAIHHDKSRVHDAQPEVRCTASVEGTIRLDPATFFPMRVEGKLVDSGCEGNTWAELHYGEESLKGPIARALFKGTTFRMEFALQPDKYGNAANSYWISTIQFWSAPFSHAGGIVCFNRRFALTPVMKSGFVVKEMRTNAQEFGAESLTRFDTVPK